jgi:hypothetical protein
MKRRTFVTTLGVTVASTALAGCGGDGPNEGEGTDDGIDSTDAGGGAESGDEMNSETEGSEGETASEEIEETPEGLEVSNSQLSETDSGASVTGTITNTGERSYEYVEVDVTLNDGDTVLGEWIDTSEEELDGLGPGDTWDFEATFEDEEVNEATEYTISVDGVLADE